MGFEPKTPVFERPKTVHALDRAATVIGDSRDDDDDDDDESASSTERKRPCLIFEMFGSN
jgi:hypothetical protein